MPQLSLYLDETTLKMIERAAKIGNVSISKWVRNNVIRSLQNEWPDDYFNLFGAVKDDSFSRPADPIPVDDVPREEL